MATGAMTRRQFLGIGTAAALSGVAGSRPATAASHPNPIRESVSASARTFSLPGPGPESVDMGDARAVRELDGLSPGSEVGVDAHTTALQADLEAKLDHYEARTVQRVVDVQDALETHTAADLDLDRTHDIDPGEPAYQLDPSENIYLVDNMTLELRPGTYVIPRTLSGRVRNWTIRGLGESPTDVRLVSRGGSYPLFDVRGGENIRIENLSIHNGSTGKNGVGLTLIADDGILVKQVHHTGLSPHEGNTGEGEQFNNQQYSLNVSVISEDGVAVTDGFVKNSPTNVAGYRENDPPLVSWGNHRGLWYIRNSVVANAGGSGASYLSRTPGGHRIENCLFMNNQKTSLRIGGGQSWVRNCTIQMDRRRAAEVNNVMFPERSGMNGIVWESASAVTSDGRNRAGGLVENCRIEALDTGGSVGYIHVDGSHGGIIIRNTEIVNETDKTSLRVEAPGSSFMNDHETPDGPHGVYLENCQFSGSGSGAAVDIDGRPDAVAQGLCVNMPNGGAVSGLSYLDGGLQRGGGCQFVESPSRPPLFDAILAHQGGPVAVSAEAGFRGFAGMVGAVLVGVLVPVFVVLGLVGLGLLLALKLLLD